MACVCVVMKLGTYIVVWNTEKNFSGCALVCVADASLHNQGTLLNMSLNSKDELDFQTHTVDRNGYYQSQNLSFSGRNRTEPIC